MPPSKSNLRTLRQHLEARQAGALNVAGQLARFSGQMSTESEMALADAITEAVEAAEALKLVQPPKGKGGRGEEPAHRQGGEFSWLADLATVRSPSPIPGISIPDAQRRLEQTHRAIAATRPALAEAARRSARDGSQPPPQYRDLSTTLGAGGEFDPPSYLTSEYASVARSTCALLNICRPTPLPPHGTKVHRPRISSAAGAVTQGTQNTTVTASVSATDELVSPVVTLFGDTPVSLQIVNRGGSLDSILAADMGESYGEKLAELLYTGTGATGEPLGILTVGTAAVDGVPGRSKITFTTATAGPGDVVEAIAKAVAAVGRYRKRPPSAIVMHPRRWSWIVGTKDSNGEPVQRPGTGTVPPSEVGPWGPLLGLPVYLTASVPTDLGTTSNEDAIVVLRGRDLLLAQSDPVFTVLSDVATQAAKLEVSLAWHRYCNFEPRRYPSAIATVEGSGLVLPTGW